MGMLQQANPYPWDRKEKEQCEAERAGCHRIGSPEEAGRNVRPCRVKRCSLAAEQMATGALFVLLQQVIQEQRPDSGYQIDKEEGGVPDLCSQRGGGQECDEANGIEVKKIPPLVFS